MQENIKIEEQKDREIHMLTKKLNKLLFKSSKHEAEIQEYIRWLEEKDHNFEIEQCMNWKKFALEKKKNFWNQELMLQYKTEAEIQISHIKSLKKEIEWLKESGKLTWGGSWWSILSESSISCKNSVKSEKKAFSS